MEDHETLMNNAENAFDTHEALPKELENHRGKVNSMSSELLRDFLLNFTPAINTNRLPPT